MNASKLLKKIQDELKGYPIEYLKNKVLRETLLVYAFIWMIIIMVLLNEFPKDLFLAAD